MKTFATFFISSATILFSSCQTHGPELGEVQGTVTLDAQPLAGAAVVFEPQPSGHASRAVTDQSGRYELVYLRDIKGALVGSHIVKIITASEDNPKERIPARFNKQSILKADVARCANVINFNLTSNNSNKR
jgi:hypothetical protein